jgi:flagella basal body P-ring formation protein FlgA
VQNASEICFELPLRQVLEADAVAAMRRSLPPGAELNIVELSKTGVPAGQLEFPPEGLEPATPGIPGTQLWRGYVRYAETLKADYWARVRITAHFTAVVAAEDLPPNKPIGAALLRIETRSGAIVHQKIAARVEDVAGRTLKRPIRAGEPIPLALLTEAAEVRRGDLVTVNVQCGPTHLQFEAIAENAANQGDEIELRNPSSGKTFRAKLGPGSSAEVNVPEGQTL